MKFELKGEGKEVEPIVELTLERVGDDHIRLIGKQGPYSFVLMSFYNGGFKKIQSVQIEGMKTDGEGRIKEIE